MLTFTLVAILGILLVIVLMNLFKKTPPPAPAPPPEDLANLKVTDARAGDALSIAGAGDRMTDLDFTVEHATRMEAGSRSWAELTGPYQERRVALRVGTNSDEETEAYLHSAPGRISLDTIGLSEDDLAQIDERQNPADNFEYDNTTWMYELSREVRGWRDNQQLAFYYWEFRTQDRRRLVGIRKAEGEPFTLTEYTWVNPSDITVYRGR
jgi:hypothetical protein